MRIWPRVPLAADVPEEVLRHAEVEALDHREEDGAALGVLAAVLAQVRVLLDVGVERLRPAPRR